MAVAFIIIVHATSSLFIYVFSELDAMNFMCRGSKQLYELDDNTISIKDLELLIITSDHCMERADSSLSTDLFKPDMLVSY